VPAVFREHMAKFYSANPREVMAALEATLASLKKDSSLRTKVGERARKGRAAAARECKVCSSEGNACLPSISWLPRVVYNMCCMLSGAMSREVRPCFVPPCVCWVKPSSTP